MLDDKKLTKKAEAYTAEELAASKAWAEKALGAIYVGFILAIPAIFGTALVIRTVSPDLPTQPEATMSAALVPHAATP
jgi:hypothetical protein